MTLFGADVVFLHPPSLYDFRRRAVLHGPISDVVPSTPIFEMYPIGFLSLCGHLERAGYSTRIINVAHKMLNSERYDPEEEIRRLSPRVFAIDLHWLPHVQGSLKMGELVKKHHPDVPVLYGGYSATYFEDELIRYPFVDYVLKGDSTEGPMVELIRAISQGADPGEIPNLTYKDRGGGVHSNPITYQPATAADVLADYALPIRKSVRFLDLKGYLPFRGWMQYPVTAVFPYRGCLHNCKTCGGSRFACGRVFHRTALSVKPPERVAGELKAVERLFHAPALIVGDVLQPGRDYAGRLLDALKAARLRNEVAFEFFNPPDEAFLARLKSAVPRYNVEISPESHDVEVRRAFGRPFDNRQLEEFLAACLRQDCHRIDLFFMIGLPRQTYASALETVDYCGDLLNRFGGKGNLHPFIAPLAPFIDPGSEVWEAPERHGYRLFARTLEEHRQLMESAPSWKYFLNYETDWMTRDEIVAATYEAALRLNALKKKHGLITAEKADWVEAGARMAKGYIRLIDEAVGRGEAGAGMLETIRTEIREYNSNTLCHKEELNWPVHFFRFNPFRIGASLAASAFKALFRPRRPRPPGIPVTLSGPARASGAKKE